MISQEAINPEKDLQVGKQPLKEFVRNISPRYFDEEIQLPSEIMQRTADVLSASGKKELGKYNIFNSMSKERKGIGTIVIDCSKIKPQENFFQLAQDEKDDKWDRIGSYEFYAKRAYTMTITIEAFTQMLQYIKDKPRLRPEEEELTAHLQLVKNKIADYGRVSSDITEDTHSLICQRLEDLAESLGLQKFILVLTNTQTIPSYAKRPLMNMFNRGKGEDETSVMFLAKEKSPEDANLKALELQQRLGKDTNPQYRGAADDLAKALDWYQTARDLKKQIETMEIRKKADAEKRQADEKILINRMNAIKSKGYNFFDLDEEFHSFNGEELKVIKQKLFVL